MTVAVRGRARAALPIGGPESCYHADMSCSSRTASRRVATQVACAPSPRLAGTRLARLAASATPTRRSPFCGCSPTSTASASVSWAAPMVGPRPWPPWSPDTRNPQPTPPRSPVRGRGGLVSRLRRAAGGLARDATGRRERADHRVRRRVHADVTPIDPHGKKDDWTPAEPCRRLTQVAQDARLSRGDQGLPGRDIIRSTAPTPFATWPPVSTQTRRPDTALPPAVTRLPG